jgi:rfaE bifunctional protein nucleotidyltransferase chain/domain
MTESHPVELAIGAEVLERLSGLGVQDAAVIEAARVLTSCLRHGGKVLVFGNGGSAADAQHFAAELVGRFERDRPPLAAIALTTDTSALTAIANDYGFEQIFSRQVEALGRTGDAALAISTSGSSANVLEAVAAAHRAGMRTLGLGGPRPCQLADAVEVFVEAPGGDTATVQEAHLAVEHALCRAIETLLIEDPRGEAASIPRSRVVSIAELAELREGWKPAGLTVVWTNGVFDLLHLGHVRSLEAARRLGDVLVVGVNDDASVAELKGPGRPLVPASERAEMVAALRPVDYVVVFEERTPEAVLERVRPDIHCKGADYSPPDGKPIPERELVEAYGGRVEFLPMLPGRSTTDLARQQSGDT